MNLLKRLRNLWKLSEWEPMKPSDNNSLEGGTTVSPIIKRPQAPKITKAEIIKKESPIEDFLHNVNKS